MTRRWWVPEVIQASAMDCGPAALKALLGGFGVQVSYARLREACQTEVDGTSIDTLADLAALLGLDAEETLVPVDHVLRPEADSLPGIAVVRTPSGVAHFVVIWRRVGPLVQVMDPSVGRVWIPASRLQRDLYQHEMPIPAEAWQAHTASKEFRGALRARLRELGVSAARTTSLVEEAAKEEGGMAALDATVRMVGAIGAEIPRANRADLVAALRGSDIPEAFWTVRPTDPDEDGTPMVTMRGALLVRAYGRQEGAAASRENLGTALAAALGDPPVSPARRIWDLLRADGLPILAVWAGGLIAAAASITVQALLLNALIDLGTWVSMPGQRAVLVGGALALVAVAGLLELGLELLQLRLGWRLDARMRLAFLRKLPRLPDRYFASRLVSDMAERSHAAHTVRELPSLAGHAVRLLFEMLLITAGLVWLDPALAPWAGLAFAVAVGVPALAQPVLADRDLRLRGHLGALSSFYLDALRGLLTIHTHGAERAVRREHEGRVVEWARSGLRLQEAVVAWEALHAALGFAAAVAILLVYLHHGGASALLVVYWALALPALGQELALDLRQIPTRRSVITRLLEPLGAPEEEVVDARPSPSPASGVAVTMEDVGVVAAGQPILHGVGLRIEAGEHVAIVGESGSGKSSLVGLLLGLHRPAGGRLEVDGAALDAAALARLRAATAWVDPQVHLWNRTLAANLRYGNDPATPVAEPAAHADLASAIERLQAGMDTLLGDGGGLLSGGEGQRVRLGRALCRDRVRLAILDEPFRGLDHAQRETLLARARAAWAEATLLVITHDVSMTLDFPRVLVAKDGTIVEDGAPRALAGTDSVYADLLQTEQAVRAERWGGSGWRHLWMGDGALRERT